MPGARYARQLGQRRIRARTLVLHGDADTVVDPRNGKLLASRIAGARLVTFPGPGHLLFWEDPVGFAAAVTSFLLTHLLMPALIPSQAKVLQTSSIAAQRYGHVDLDDLQNEKSYAPQKAYGTGKLENILFTRELQRRFHDQGISAAAFHPGVVATSFASDTTHLMHHMYHSPLKHLFTISPARGAEPLVWLAEGTPGSTWQPGGYYAKNKLATTNAQADDPHLAQQLWDRSADMLKLQV